MIHPFEADRERSTGERSEPFCDLCGYKLCRCQPAGTVDGPEQAAQDAYFQALLEDSYYRQKFNLAPRRIA